MSEYSVDDLVSFLDYAAAKGLLNKATASAKKIAVERVFAVVDEGDRNDVRSIDLSNVMSRFINLEGSGFRPDSLASYQSRVKSAIEEFIEWKQNPMTFRPNKRGTVKKSKPQPATAKTVSPMATAVPGPILTKPATLSLPVPIRADLTVQIDGIPFDLTKAEATKIANVVLAMAWEN